MSDNMQISKTAQEMIEIGHMNAEITNWFEESLVPGQELNDNQIQLGLMVVKAIYEADVTLDKAMELFGYLGIEVL